MLQLAAGGRRRRRPRCKLHRSARAGDSASDPACKQPLVSRALHPAGRSCTRPPPPFSFNQAAGVLTKLELVDDARNSRARTRIETRDDCLLGLLATRSTGRDLVCMLRSVRGDLPFRLRRCVERLCMQKLSKNIVSLCNGSEAIRLKSPPLSPNALAGFYCRRPHARMHMHSAAERRSGARADGGGGGNPRGRRRGQKRRLTLFEFGRQYATQLV